MKIMFHVQSVVKSDFTPLREFNLMFKTNRGVVEEKQKHYIFTS